MNFVAECTTTSAPSVSGRCARGVANVLSTTTNAPAARPATHSTGRSATSSSGFVGDSSHSTWAPAAAAIIAPVSVTSTGMTTQRPFASSAASSARTPAYESVGTTIFDPVGSVSSTAAHAPMPDENATALPPSRAPRTSSKACQVAVPPSRA